MLVAAAGVGTVLRREARGGSGAARRGAARYGARVRPDVAA